MSGSMIERVTRAILAKVPYGYGMTEAEAIEYARAAIEAMREPTSRMKAAGADPWAGVGETTLMVVWQDMIDAALKP